MMPEMDGFEVCNVLKADSLTQHIPIIMLTTKGEIDDKIEGIETGADDYVTKPFDLGELKARGTILKTSYFNRGLQENTHFVRIYLKYIFIKYMQLKIKSLSPADHVLSQPGIYMR